MITGSRFDRLGSVKEENPCQAEREDDSESVRAPGPLVEGRDYYLEKGLMVFTGRFLLARGYCCQSGCRHCPYPKEEIK